MSVIGLVSLAERLLNQGSAQNQDLPTTQKGSNAAAANDTAGPAEDLFTPSGQNGQTPDAGLFSVAQFSFFSAAADFLLGQGNFPQATVPPASAAAGNGVAGQQNASTANLTGFATPQPIVNLGPLGTAGNAANAGNAAPIAAVQTPAATNGATANAATAATTAAGSLATQQQLQSLNTALAALGLTPQEIQQLDQIASILNDFDPAAYTALAYQLEQLALAQQPATGNTRNAAANTANNPAPANGTPVHAANGEGNGFHIQELVIKFAGVQVQSGTTANGTTGAAQGTPAAGNGTFQATAFNLQIEELNLTLTNGNGRTAQVQVPQAKANAAATKARAAAA